MKRRPATKPRPVVDEGTIILRRTVSARTVALGQMRRNLKGRHGRFNRRDVEQMIGDRWDKPFALASVPIDALNYQDAVESDPARVARALRYAQMDTPLPPAFVTYRANQGRRETGQGWVSDGNHRVLAAALRGNRTALVFIPLEDLHRLSKASQRIGLTTGMVDLSKPRKAATVRNPSRPSTRRKTPSRRAKKRATR